jgi:hypothetical protein
MITGAIQAANQAEKEQIILMKKIHKIVLKSNRKRMQKEEKEMEKQTKLNAGAVNNLTQIEEFMAMVSTQQKNPAKATREKKKKKFTSFFTTAVSTFRVQEE